MAEITLEKVVKKYGAVNVVHGIDLTIAHEEFVVLVGPSGCGKSTTLRMIAGLEDISGGIVRIGDRVVNDLPPRKRNISMVFQNYALYPHMNVRENLGFGLKIAGESPENIAKRVDDAAGILGLTPLLDRTPAELSGGQRQRVAMGRAIVRRPEVFLFDEPLSNLDAKLRGQMRAEIKKLHQKVRTTVVYVTHDQVEAMTLADKIVVLQAGVIEQAGSPLELYHHPRNLFVAGFIGSPKMNFLDATVTAVAGDGAVVALPGGGSITVPVQPGHVKVGDKVTLGVRPEHLLPAADGEIRGEVQVVERLGGETFLYTQVEGGPSIIVQADGESPVRTHERIAVKLNPATCHLFDSAGLAVERAQRHPLADMRRPTARMAS